LSRIRYLAAGAVVVAVFAEAYYDARRDMIAANAEFTDRDRLVGFYCQGISGGYAKFYRRSAHVEVDTHLVFADFSLCG